MTSLRHIPAAPLSNSVRCFWYWEGCAQHGSHTKERLLPNGEPSIIFNLRDEPIRVYDPKDFDRGASYGTAVLSGARTDYFGIDVHAEERVFGIQFRPGGMFPFVKAPASEFVNRDVHLEEVWKSAAGEMRERLLAAKSPRAMFAEAETCLLRQTIRRTALHPAVGFAVRQFCTGPQAVSSVLDRIGFSERYFVALFRGQVGLTPKAFSRVRRFQRVLQSVHEVLDVDWAQVAVACGYYDQPHFIHDFRRFSGLTPSEYAVYATPHLNHVAVR